MKVRSAIGLHCSRVWIKTGSQKGSKIRYLKLLTLLSICSVCLVAVPYAHAQRVGAGSGVAPGYAGQANGNPAYGDPGYGNQASGDPAYGDPGYGNQASGNPAYGNQSANVPEDLPADIALCLYRVLQESLQNIRKHAQTKKAEVRLVRIENEIVLAVEDSGNGFELKDTRRKGGLGLVSMGERVRTVRGSVSISSRPGQGTLIEVRVPLERR
jgi:anti-sigma regulatory factor (Ser/Thr protein kinase)